MTVNSPNSPIFSAALLLCYTVDNCLCPGSWGACVQACRALITHMKPIVPGKTNSVALTWY